jgi:hypothetical protein
MIQSLGQASDIVEQLPDLIVWQSCERHHAGSWRPVFDDPEQLAVWNVLHHRPAGEVSRWGNQCSPHETLTVALLAMTQFARTFRGHLPPPSGAKCANFAVSQAKGSVQLSKTARDVKTRA